MSQKDQEKYDRLKEAAKKVIDAYLYDEEKDIVKAVLELTKVVYS